MIHKETASLALLDLVKQLCSQEELQSFRLVGGTALALQIGHRISVDIDLFSNEVVDKLNIELALRKIGPKSNTYKTTHNVRADIKGVRVDLYDDWYIPFRNSPLIEDGIRMARLEDIAAFKLEAITGRREKKDYIDLFFIFKELDPIKTLLDFPNYNSQISTKSIVFALSEAKEARENSSLMPEMLIPISWDEVCNTMNTVLVNYIIQLEANKQNKPVPPSISNSSIKEGVISMLNKFGVEFPDVDPSSNLSGKYPSKPNDQKR